MILVAKFKKKLYISLFLLILPLFNSCSKNNLDLMNKLDDVTIKYEGQFYLAKDSRLNKEIFKRSDTKFGKYSKFRSSKMKEKFSSAQSERLGL